VTAFSSGRVELACWACHAYLHAVEGRLDASDQGIVRRNPRTRTDRITPARLLEASSRCLPIASQATAMAHEIWPRGATSG